ncbi:MAG: hypothetical protein BMS9Abin11_0323 [Gammaproteobacteria bacterium]|nr:MAG: hypothetical protein BMS9Abin11_0323 [Gammaproteobacteria bacterium]
MSHILKRVIAIALSFSLFIPIVSTQAYIARKPNIEVCFVLDTTGSMGGLISGAKRKIWYIANQIASARQTPNVKFCLIGFRDRGDVYVTKKFQMTDDLDSIYQNLQSFQAQGGGDTPESVNQALYEAVKNIGWSKKRNTLRVIFLVGDSPPHMDYQDDVKYYKVAMMAKRKDIIINTIQAGSNYRTTPIWKEIAQLTNGAYSAIPQSGGVTIIITPYDTGIARLNRRIGSTIIPWGSEKRRRFTMEKQARSEAAPVSSASDRIAYNRATNKVVQGGGDLIQDIREGKVKMGSVKDKYLPAKMRPMSKPQRMAYINKQGKKRMALQQQVSVLVKKREAYIRAERKKRAKGGKIDAFDEEVARTIRKQAIRKGIKY